MLRPCLKSYCLSLCLWLEMDRLDAIDHRQQGSHVSGLAPIGLGELAAPPPPPRPPYPYPLPNFSSTSMRSPSTCTFREIFQILAVFLRRRRIDAVNASRPASSHHCTPAYWHVLIILQYGLPLKVNTPEHNHAQSKAQTSYIKETVNSLRVHSTPPQKCFSLDFWGWTWEKLK